MHAIQPLAGLCTYEQAAKAGTSVDETVAFLRRLARMEHRTLLVLSAHLMRVPEWEVKCALALHVWQDAEHCAWLRTRVTEMRKPPHFLDRADDAALEAFFEELLRSESTRELLTGVYAVLKPELLAAIEAFRLRDNPLADQPTLRLFRFLELEEREQVAWGEQALAALGGPDPAWQLHLSSYLSPDGGANVRRPVRRGRSSSSGPPQRDERFTRLWSSRGHLPAYDAAPGEVRWRMLYVRLTEMPVVELLGLALFEWPDASFETHRELARHLWDEARHAMFGEVAFETRGFDWQTVPHEVAFASYPSSELQPRDRYALLYRSEHAVMSDSKRREVGMQHAGKRSQHQAAVASGDPLCTLFQDFDWADEVLHVNIARRVLADAFPTREERDEAGARAMAGLRRVVDADLALPRAHWWDEFYDEVRRRP